MRSAAAGLCLVVLVAIAFLAATILRHPLYSPDGLVYARFAARDAGYSDRNAAVSARKLYETTPLAGVPRYRALIELSPSIAFTRSRIFANRPLYPWLASLLLPLAGFRALFIVSAVSYVAFGIALYWLLVGLGRPWFAAILTIVVLALPLTRSLAASDLTDMLAAVWWTVALAALLRALHTRNAVLITLLTVASVLLALTRPAPYLIVLPAGIAAALTGAWSLLAASLASALVYAVVAAGTHAYGALEQLRWIYRHEPGVVDAAFGDWYRSALVATIRSLGAQLVRPVLPVLLVAGAIYAAFKQRQRDEMIVLLAAALACVIAIPFNPVPFANERVVIFPLLPVFCAMAQCFVTASLPNTRLNQRSELSSLHRPPHGSPSRSS